MYKLYLDESGKPTLSNLGVRIYDGIFSFGGIMVGTTAEDFIRTRGNQIRFKYWGHKSDTVFHAYEIRRNEGPFSIFASDHHRETEFRTDLLQYIRSSQFRLIWIGVNKPNWLLANPPVANVVRIAATKSPSKQRKMLLPYEVSLSQKVLEEVFRIYLSHLMRKNYLGQVVVEAADKYQDQDILAVYNKILSSGFGRWTTAQIRDHLTGVSFVTKKNRDAETQLADMATLFLNLEARKNDNLLYLPSSFTVFDEEMVNAFKEKSFVVNYDHLTTLNSVQKLA